MEFHVIIIVILAFMTGCIKHNSENTISNSHEKKFLYSSMTDHFGWSAVLH